MRIFSYFLFAAIATAFNILAQWPVFFFVSEWWALYVALFVGTLTGLITKYILDKRYIFNYQATSKKDDLYKFGLYSLMGVLTTIIFWGTEMAFYYAFEFNGAQYVGGGLGLMVGYIVKYLLDRKYVFKVNS